MEKQKTWRLSKQNSGDLLTQLLFLRGCQTEKEKEQFLNPPAPQKLVEDPTLVGLEKDALDAAVKKVAEAIATKRAILIHGDYDVDGICATAILWRAIYQGLDYKNCLPFIPNRFDHGYGLSQSSVDSINDLRDLGDLSHLSPLLITVDCGITSFKEVEYAKEKGFEVLVLDHHVKPERLPKCSILWTDRLCAGGIAWVFAQSLFHLQGGKDLELAALATIADIQPLTGANRSLVKYGLEKLSQTQNVGLKQLIEASGISGRKMGTFEVGWVLAPRLNASGRLEESLMSLRLLCTGSVERASQIAKSLNAVNSQRQELTRSMVETAKGVVGETGQAVNVVVHEEFHEGVIGLIAGKLVSHYGSPAVVIRKGEEFSKASARSIAGFNIVEFLRSLGDHFENVGGHAGAAGFTIRTSKIESFLVAISQKITDLVLPKPVLEVEAKLEFKDLTLETLEKVRSLEPFGLGNPEPVFLLENALIVGARTVGTDNRHLKLRITGDNQSSVLGYQSSGNIIDCIGFDLGEKLTDLVSGDKVDLVFTLSEDDYSGHNKISLKLKDFEKAS